MGMNLPTPEVVESLKYCPSTCVRALCKAILLPDEQLCFLHMSRFLGIVHTMMVQYSKFNKMVRSMSEAGFRYSETLLTAL